MCVGVCVYVCLLVGMCVPAGSKLGLARTRAKEGRAHEPMRARGVGRGVLNREDLSNSAAGVLHNPPLQFYWNLRLGVNCV